MRVGVVGAGVTGLALTHYLAERDVDVVAFEAASEPGGVVRSGRVDGSLLEYGPQRIRLSSPVADLVADLDLEDDLLVADDDLPLYVYGDGDLGEVPRSLSTFVRTDLLSWRGKLRALAEPLTAPGEPSERAADLFERKFGAETYRNVIGPLFGGMYGSDPATMPAKYSLERLLVLEERAGSLLRPALERAIGDGETPPPASFADGLQALPEALYDAHRPYVHLGTAVSAVRERRDDEPGPRYVLEAGGRSVPVDRVVLTVPAPAAASILAPLEDAAVAPLRKLRYNSLALVHLRAAGETDLEGFGYQVRRDEPLSTLGATWNDALFDRDGVYTAFLGDAVDSAVLERSDEFLGETARAEFTRVTGVDAELLEVTRLDDAFPAYDGSWAALEDLALPDGITLATNYVGRTGVPSRVREAHRLADRFDALEPEAATGDEMRRPTP